VRAVLSILDGIVGGEGDGPLALRDRPLGVVLASLDPVALDLVAVALMGYRAEAIPKIREAMAAPSLRVTAVRSAEDVAVTEVDVASFAAAPRPLSELRTATPFAAHPGWRGALEARTPAPGMSSSQGRAATAETQAAPR